MLSIAKLHEVLGVVDTFSKQERLAKYLGEELLDDTGAHQIGAELQIPGVVQSQGCLQFWVVTLAEIVEEDIRAHGYTDGVHFEVDPHFLVLLGNKIKRGFPVTHLGQILELLRSQLREPAPSRMQYSANTIRIVFREIVDEKSYDILIAASAESRQDHDDLLLPFRLFKLPLKLVMIKVARDLPINAHLPSIFQRDEIPIVVYIDVRIWFENEVPHQLEPGICRQKRRPIHFESVQIVVESIIERRRLEIQLVSRFHMLLVKVFGGCDAKKQGYTIPLES